EAECNCRTRADPRREFVQNAMSMMLNCPRCDGDTELRGTMDAWYITWCPSCERLWRLGLGIFVLEGGGGRHAPAPTVGQTRGAGRGRRGGEGEVPPGA